MSNDSEERPPKYHENTYHENKRALRCLEARSELLRVGCVAVPLMALMFFQISGKSLRFMPLIELLGGALVLLGGGKHIFRSAWRALYQAHLNSDVLVALGALASWGTIFISLAEKSFPSFGAMGAIFVALHLTGRYIELRLRDKALRQARSLVSLFVPAQIFADRVVRRFIPVVFILAMSAGIFWSLIFWLHGGIAGQYGFNKALTAFISTFVIACPGALALAAPMTFLALFAFKGGSSPEADSFSLSDKFFRAVRQNVFLAFVYNGIAIPVAMMGHLSPVVAITVMALSLLSVTLNSLRLGISFINISGSI